MLEIGEISVKGPEIVSALPKATIASWRREERKRRRLQQLAEQKIAEGQARIDAGYAALERIPFGKPVIVGSQCAKRDSKKYRWRARKKIIKGVALQREGQALLEICRISYAASMEPSQGGLSDNKGVCECLPTT